MLEDPIARRYFVMNFFDGIMTAFGLVTGGALAINDPGAVLKAGFGTSIAMMVSGFFGAYMAERAEREREKKELERHLMKNLKGTEIEESAKKASIKLAAIDAFSPFAGAWIALFPFLFSKFGIISYMTSILASVAASLALLALLGVYIGRLTGESPAKSAVSFAIGGIIVGILSGLLE